MTQLTIRIPSEALEKSLRSLAKERGWSLNQASNYLMLKGAGLLAEKKDDRIGNQLDAFIGSWSDDEAEEFMILVNDAFGKIDEELWR